jgi:hypothetical protein
MHHLAVEFEDELVGDLDAADPSHAPDIVAPEIEQHEMLGSLLLVHQQLFGERFVLARRRTPSPRASDRPDGDPAIAHPDQDLRR